MQQLLRMLLLAFCGGAALGSSEICGRGSIRIGGPQSFSGARQIGGTAERNGAKLWADKVNAAGGMFVKFCNKNLTVALVQQDDSSDTKKVAALATSMKSSVDYFLAPYSSSATLEVMKVLQDKILLTSAASESVFSQGRSNLFGTSSLARTYMTGGLQALYDKGARSVVFAHSTSKFSTATCQGAREAAGAMGYTVLSTETYGANDLSMLKAVMVWRDLSATPDVVVGCGHFEDAVILAATAKVQELRPKAFLMTQAATPDFVNAVGVSTSSQFLGPSQWLASLQYSGPGFGKSNYSSQDFARDYKASFGSEAPYQASSIAAACLALGHALGNAGASDVGTVAAALKALDVPSFFGQLKFTANGNIDPVGKPMATGQVQSGTIVAVVPAAKATGTVKYPHPAWTQLPTTLKQDPSSISKISVVEASLLLEYWIRRASNKVAAEYMQIYKGLEDYGDCPYTDSCKNLDESSFTQQGDWNFKVSFDKSLVRVGETTDTSSLEFRRSMCLAADNRPLAASWKKHFKDLGEPKNNFGYFLYGHQASGTLAIYPGAKYCKAYDPRFRPWYAHAATGAKNMVIVVDTSGSMGRSSRMVKARAAVEKVIKTLVFADYVTVVTFSSSASVYGTGLLEQATAENRQRLIEWTRKLTHGGGTNYEAGFSAGFQALLSSKKHSGCNNLLLFMSDGDVAQGKTGKDLEKAITAYNSADVDAIILTYQFGDDVSSKQLKNIACQNRGIFWKVSDKGDELANTMASYLKYFGATSTIGRMKWQNYTFASDNTKVGYSACMPVYDTTQYPKELLGVTCMDMTIFGSINALQQRPDWRVFEMKRIADSQSCDRVENLNKKDLESLRQYASGSAALCSGETGNNGGGSSGTSMVALSAGVFVAMLAWGS